MKKIIILNCIICICIYCFSLDTIIAQCGTATLPSANSASCNLDINLASQGLEWQSDKRSVARIVRPSGNGNFCNCSGSFLNTVSQNGDIYFLTARHCVNSQAEAENLTFLFNYEKGSINPSITVNNYYTYTGGADSIASFMDFTLLKINQSLPTCVDLFFAGWDVSDSRPTSSAIIHHPKGDPKKITVDNDLLTISDAINIDEAPCINPVTFISQQKMLQLKLDFFSGIVQEGSSGAPLFNQNHRVVGNLSWVNGELISITPCPPYLIPPSIYSQRLFDSWAASSNISKQLKHWLDPENSNVLKIDGYDPNDALWTADNSYEPNNSYLDGEYLFNTLKDQPATGFLRSYIQIVNDQDYYKFKLTNAGKITFTLSDVPAGQTYGYELQKSDGSIIQPIGGTYYLEPPAGTSEAAFAVKVFGSGPSHSIFKAYKLAFNWEPCIDGEEPNSNVNPAPALLQPYGNSAALTTVSSEISSDNDTDWWDIPIDKSGNLTLTLFDLPFDYQLQLSGPLGNLLKQSLNQGTTQEVITYHYTGTTPIHLYAVIYGDNGAYAPCNSYKLRLEWQPDAPCVSINLTSQTVLASSSIAQDGKVLLNVSGGQAPITFLWSTGQTTQDLINVPAGVYTVTVTGSDGCTKSTSAYVGIQGSPNPYCSGTATLNQASGSFTDGSGGQDYTPYSVCQWHINPTNATSISLSFPFFNLGDGDQVLIYDGTSANAPLLATVDNTSLTSIYHSSGGNMFIKFISNGTDEDQGWTANYSSTSVNGGTKLVAYEYWFDDDANQRQQIYFTPISAKFLNTSFNTDGLTNGVHRFHIRFLDEYEHWSSVLSQFFVKQPIAEPDNALEEYEYWFDDDYASRGSGGTSGGQSFELNETIYESAQLSNGVHRFHVHFRDRAGNWSSVLSQFFVRQPGGNFPNKIAAYRYWFDQNDATMTTVNLPTPVNPYELSPSINVNNLSAGQHTVHFQFKDINGNWSSVTNDNFNNIANSVVSLFTPQTTVLCNNGSVTFINNSVGADTYLWDFGDGSTSTAYQPAHLYTQPGAYTVSLKATNSTTGASQTYILPTPIFVDAINLQVTGGGNMCPGTGLQLTASGAFSYQWSPATGLNMTTGSTVTANPATSTLYTVVGSTEHGCTKNSNVYVNVVALPQVVINSSATNICAGEESIIELSGANIFTVTPSTGVTQLAINKFRLSPTATTTYTINGQNQCGTASSIFTLNVLPNSSGTATAQICQGESFTIGGQTFTTTGVYQVPLTAFNGCDSVITLNLTVAPAIQTTVNEKVCFGDSVEIGGQVFSSSGSYQIPLIAVNGCDSIINLHLTVLPQQNVPFIGLNGTNELACNTFASSYTWYLNGQFFTTTTVQTLTVTQSGSYTVEFTSFDGCISPVSLPYVFNSVGTKDILLSGIRIFPNPTDGVVYIEHDEGVELDVFVTMIDGRQIRLNHLIGEKTDQLDLNLMPPGLYLITMKYQNGILMEKLVKY